MNRSSLASFDRIWTVGCTALGLLLVSGAAGVLLPPKTPAPQVRTAVADSSVLAQRYAEWKSARLSADPEGESTLRISLVPSRLHRVSALGGSVSVDPRQGRLSARVQSAGVPERVGLWLTRDGRLSPGSPESEALVYVGEFSADAAEPGELRLDADLSELLEADFRIGGLGVAPRTDGRLGATLLTGSPGLFERLFAEEQRRGAAQPQSGDGFALADLLTPVALASEATGFPDVFNDLVTQGEDVFFNETFEGNGRSCGTCHPATENFTIDTAFIASLPSDDPLFAAENVPALMFGHPDNLDEFGNPQRFENPMLMREFGLIVENLDGLGDLQSRFVMRSVPHNIGMSVSVQRPPLDPGSQEGAPEERTGWSGDGAPSGDFDGVMASGRLRDFMLGAIVQHYPKTPARSFTGPNPDFRVATLAELDAVEAFLIALGRQSDLELTAGSPDELMLLDPSAEAGRLLFRDGVPGGTRTCNGCHGNAGANVLAGPNPGNRNFNTGVEQFLQNRITDGDFTVVGEPRPVDGGFGTQPDGSFGPPVPQPGSMNENFGNGTFNTVSLVEAADTPPFFHNNVARTLEEAIAFYNSPEFQAANGGSIPFTAPEIAHVANFLRVINALDNIESSVLRQSDRVILALDQTPLRNDVIDRILAIMAADTEDAIEVLEQGDLHNDGGLPFNAVKQLERTLLRIDQATNTNASAAARSNHIAQAQQNLGNAAALMRQ